jgi:hypothetical protein
MPTEDQAFWLLMALAPVLVLLCVFYRRLDGALVLLGLRPRSDLPAIFWLRVVGAFVGIFVAIAAPLIRWWLL